jgi:hypothetical protein
MEKKIGQPASVPAMFEILTGGPVCPGSTTVRLRRVDCPEDDQIEVLILDTTVQVFRGGQYVGEYLGGYEGAVASVGMAPIQQSSFNSSAQATMKMQTLQAAPMQTVKAAPSAGARQKTGFDRSPAKVLSLHNACSGGDAAAVKVLLDQGVDPDAPGEKGKTALMIAASKGSLPVVEVLLAAGADPNIGSEDGKTPLSEAFQRGHKAVMSKLFSSTFSSLNVAPRDLGPGGATVVDDAVPENAHDNLREVTMKLSKLNPTQDQFYSPARRNSAEMTEAFALDPEMMREQQLKSKMQALAENSPAH